MFCLYDTINSLLSRFFTKRNIQRAAERYIVLKSAESSTFLQNNQIAYFAYHVTKIGDARTSHLVENRLYGKIVFCKRKDRIFSIILHSHETLIHNVYQKVSFLDFSSGISSYRILFSLRSFWYTLYEQHVWCKHKSVQLERKCID